MSNEKILEKVKELDFQPIENLDEQDKNKMPKELYKFREAFKLWRSEIKENINYYYKVRVSVMEYRSARDEKEGATNIIPTISILGLLKDDKGEIVKTDNFFKMLDRQIFFKPAEFDEISVLFKDHEIEIEEIRKVVYGNDYTSLREGLIDARKVDKLYN